MIFNFLKLNHKKIKQTTSIVQIADSIDSSTKILIETYCRKHTIDILKLSKQE